MNKMSTATSAELKTQRIVFAGLFSAISFVLFLLEFPVIPGLSYLKLDFSDVPALIGAIFFGPVFGVTVELIKNLIEMLVKGLGTQMGFGNIMNFLVGCAYIVPFSIIFNKISKKDEAKSWKSIAVSSIAGIACIVGVGIAGNYIIAPLFFKYFMGIELTSKTLWTAIWGATTINAIKGIMLSIVISPLIMFFSTKMGSMFSLKNTSITENSKNKETEKLEK
ncbi:MAG: ECF transporter S component [Clostridia bacterium]|nr:ECF transporter S component [Clostridia bacterium]